jgi:aldose 1-epimerase
MKPPAFGLPWHALVLGVCLLSNLPSVHSKESSHSMNQKPLVAGVETDVRSGLKVVVLKYADPARPGMGLECRIAPEAGSNLDSLKVDGTELLVQPEKLGLPALRYGCPILFPTPNRVRDSKFTFDGQSYSFKANERTHFIHGLVHSLKWNIRNPSADSKSAWVETFLDWDSGVPDFGLFPIKHRLTMKFALNSQGVKLSFMVDNHDQKRLPFGLAFHPWFQILGSRAETYLRVPAQKHMEAEGLLPTGNLEDLDGSPYDLRVPVSLANLRLDDVYWGMLPEQTPGYEARDKGLKVTLGASKEFTHMVVFTPLGKPFFCMENQTCSTDAHNLHARGLQKEANLLIVDPGKSLSGWLYVKVEREHQK